ncbi:MAG: gliding motility-associated C-terminal domain-containing protein [Bacteroidetes bacterium]|nr:gliding motility-associated C-terminal domain-containing protein [Bacteroidota bacterium]
MSKSLGLSVHRWLLVLFVVIATTNAFAQTITRVEYFFDSDPGVGNATALPVTPGTTINETYNLSTTALSAGFHTLNARVRDNTGKWSLFTTRTFYLIANPFSNSPSVNITRAEYFYDSDPGIGNGTNIPVTANPSLNITINAPTAPLAAGFHTVNVRVRDDQGRWSLFTTRTFYLVPATALPANLVKLEYFVGTDPGIGQATSVNVSAAPTVNQLFTLNLPLLTPGNYTLNVRAKDSKGFWSNAATAPFTITACPTLTAPSATGGSSCGPGAVTLNATGATGSQVYRWYADASTTSILFTGPSFTTPLLSNSTTYFVSIFDSGICESARTAVTATINPVPTAPTAVGASGCASSSLTLTASGGTAGQYRWYTVATGGTPITGQTNATFTTPSLSTTTTYFVSINNGTCESTRTSVTATINPTPSAPTVVGASGCAPSSLTLTASGGSGGQYRWYTVATGGAPIAGQTNATFTTPSLSNTTIFFVSINNGTCESARTSVTAAITGPCAQPPVISTQPISTPVGSATIPVNLVALITTFTAPLDLNSITVVVQPPSGAKATVSNGRLTIDYTGIAFTGREFITIRACDTNGNCATQQFEIEVAGDVVVFNAVSPNGANPSFIIQNIELIPETKSNVVTIFDRWQNEVWRGENYDNTSVVFKGTSNEGNDLPTGTYFYKIEFGSGKKPKTGFISLKR